MPKSKYRPKDGHILARVGSRQALVYRYQPKCRRYQRKPMIYRRKRWLTIISRSPKNATPNPSTSPKFLYTPSNPRTYHAKKKDASKLSIPK